MRSKPVAELPRVRFAVQRLPEHIETRQVRAFNVDLEGYLLLLVGPPDVRVLAGTGEELELLRAREGEVVERRSMLVPPMTNAVVERLVGGDWIVAGDALARGPAVSLRLRSDGVAEPLRLGRGIAEIQADPDGGLWVSYGPLSAWVLKGAGSIGASGLARLGANGDVVWRFHPDGIAAGLQGVDDILALNVSVTKRLAYVWSPYRLIEFDDAKPKVHRVRSGFVEGFAVDGPRLMTLACERPGDAFRLRMLGRPPHVSSRRWRLLWEAGVEGIPVNRRGRVVSRSGALHALAGPSWVSLTVGDANAQMEGRWHKRPFPLPAPRGCEVVANRHALHTDYDAPG